MNDQSIVTSWLRHIHPELALNEQGFASLVSEETALVAEVPANTGVCHVFGVVMPPPEEPAFTLWLQEALRLNLMGKPLFGAWLAYDPEEHALFLCRNFTVAHTTAEEFAAGIQEMAGTIVAVRGRLSVDEDTAEELNAEAALSAQ